MDGYGTVLSIRIGTLQEYQTTAVSCLKGDSAQRTGNGTYTAADGTVLTVRTQGGTGRGSMRADGSVSHRNLRRIAKLPDACARRAPTARSLPLTSSGSPLRRWASPARCPRRRPKRRSCLRACSPRHRPADRGSGYAGPGVHPDARPQGRPEPPGLRQRADHLRRPPWRPGVPADLRLRRLRGRWGPYAVQAAELWIRSSARSALSASKA